MEERGRQRKIIHCDCDSFYASVEERDDPSLVGQPLAVGGSPDARGVVATCNYAARNLGVHSAMPMSRALKIIPWLIVVPTNMEKYRAASKSVHQVFQEYTSLIEPLSLDEAFLDVTNSDHLEGSATLIAREIRQKVKERVGITISAGIAPNKFLAKIASDWNKPDGEFTIAPSEVEQFILNLPVDKLFGVGKVTAEKLKKLNVFTCGDLQGFRERDLTAKFGKFGKTLFKLCRGIDERELSVERKRKSLSTERTFSKDLKDIDLCSEKLEALIVDLRERLLKLRPAPPIKALTMKIKFSDFTQTTVSRQAQEIDSKIFHELLRKGLARKDSPIRLLGVGVEIREALSETLDDRQKSLNW